MSEEDPLIRQLDSNAVRFAELLRENYELEGQVTQLRSALAARNDELRSALARLREAQAQADLNAEYTVFIVPGGGHLQDALAHLAQDPSVKDGDRVRVPAAGLEFVRLAGIWTAT